MFSYDQYPIPSDWEMLFDFATKKHFFVNHKTKTTTWEDPRKAIFDKDDLNANFVNAKDFINDNDDISTIINVLNKEDDVSTFIKKLKDKYPTIDDNIIKEVFIKSKGNFSNAEVLLRQETRKETKSNISNSMINYSSSNYNSNCNLNKESRFNLSERSKYKTPEKSKDRVKFQFRQEFSDVDIRILDRILEVTNYSIEESRKIISKTKTTKKRISEDINQKSELNYQKKSVLMKEKEDKNKSTKIDSNFFGNFKHFVSRSLNQTPEEICTNDPTPKTKKTIAAGANPKNVKGAKSKNGYGR